MEEKLIIKDNRELFEKIQNDSLLTKTQKRVLSGIIQNEDVEVTDEDIEEYGEGLTRLREMDLTTSQRNHLETIINEVLGFLIYTECKGVWPEEDDLPF